MDSALPPDDWPAFSSSSSALFSPSKARAQQAQARDWAAVDAWLTRIYHARHHQVPFFERNEETLHALLTLATLNEEADEVMLLTGRVEKAALLHGRWSGGAGDGGAWLCFDELTAVTSGSLPALADCIMSVDGRTLQVLADLAMFLGSSETMVMAQRIRDLTTIDFELGQQLRRAEYQRKALQKDHARLASLLTDLEQEPFQPSSELHDDIAEWTRSSRNLRTKLVEYDDRLAALRSHAPPAPSIEDVIQAQAEARQLQHRLDELRTKLAAFDNLPPEPKTAELELQRAKNELLKYKRHRQSLVGGVTSDG